MTNQNTVPTVVPPRLRGDEAGLFSEFSGPLFHSVRRAVRATDELIEDACSYAWMQLLRCQPHRETAFAWLRVVAIHQAWKLSRRERLELSLDAPLASGVEGLALAETLADPRFALSLSARDALRAVGELRPLHRSTFSRHLAGLSYGEIAAESGRSIRQVERHVRSARAALRAGRGENAPAAP